LAGIFRFHAFSSSGFRCTQVSIESANTIFWKSSYWKHAAEKHRIFPINQPISPCSILEWNAWSSNKNQKESPQKLEPEY
jgi:hypothetical protein